MGQQIKGQTRPLEVVVTHNSHRSELSLPICIIGVAILPLEAGEAAEMYNMGTTVLVEWQGLSAVTCTSEPGGGGGWSGSVCQFLAMLNTNRTQQNLEVTCRQCVAT